MGGGTSGGGAVRGGKGGGVATLHVLRVSRPVDANVLMVA